MGVYLAVAEARVGHGARAEDNCVYFAPRAREKRSAWISAGFFFWGGPTSSESPGAACVPWTDVAICPRVSWNPSHGPEQMLNLTN
jgi:hypothetical protein